MNVTETGVTGSFFIPIFLPSELQNSFDLYVGLEHNIYPTHAFLYWDW